MNFGVSARIHEDASSHQWVVKTALFLLSVLMLIAVPSESRAQTTTTYSNTTTAAINSSTSCTAPLVRNFTVGTSYIVSDVDLGFIASHTWRGDISLTLQSPAGTRVQVVTGDTSSGGSADNLNVRLNDGGTEVVNATNSNHNTNNPPYTNNFIPNAPLSTFNGENSLGTWRLEICDGFSGSDDGTFRRADLFLTSAPTNYADLSLTKSFGATSANTGRYTLSVTNASASTSSATGVTVSDSLPSGVTLTGTSGTGTYSGGVWTLGTAIAPGETLTIELDVNITATSGTITNIAQIRSSSVADIDSTPNNGVTSEDDYASVSFSAGGRIAGYVPSLTSICPISNQLNFSWATPTAWSPSGSLAHSYNVTGLGNITFNVTPPTSGFTTSTPEINTANTGGGASGTRALYFYMNNGDETQSGITTLTLPTAVPGLQFKMFDVDYAANQFTDKVTVTGTYNGATVFPTLSNNTANYVSGNSVIGDGASGATDPFGNVVVTFTSPVDSVTVEYGNHLPTTPTSSGNQAMSIHDFTFCQPTTSLSVTKISSIISDPVSGATNPKRIPGAIVQYCILISNSGGAQADAVVATDNLAGPFTYTPGTMKSGSNCGSAATVEDDNATGADESDPYGASIAGSTITANAATLAPASSFALTFRVTVD